MLDIFTPVAGLPEAPWEDAPPTDDDRAKLPPAAPNPRRRALVRRGRLELARDDREVDVASSSVLLLLLLLLLLPGLPLRCRLCLGWSASGADSSAQNAVLCPPSPASPPAPPPISPTVRPPPIPPSEAPAPQLLEDEAVACRRDRVDTEVVRRSAGAARGSSTLRFLLSNEGAAEALNENAAEPAEPAEADGFAAALPRGLLSTLRRFATTRRFGLEEPPSRFFLEGEVQRGGEQ